jgi:sugar phosphate isomerase/epimerase
MTGFEPRFMKVGILTAALQELTSREQRDQDPDLAIEDWLVFAREVGADYIQLSAALHPSEADVSPEAMLDPVANTLDLRQKFDEARARRVHAAMKSSNVGLSDLSYFDNLLHHDAKTRQKKHDFLMRVFDAATLLGVNAVCGFVGRNQQRTMDENLIDFEHQFIPLLQAAKELAQQHRLHARCMDRAP